METEEFTKAVNQQDMLFHILDHLPEFNSVSHCITEEKGPISVCGLSDAQAAHFLAAVMRQANRNFIFIAQNEYCAQKIYEDFYRLYAGDAILFPSREMVLFDVEARNYDIVFRRIRTLDRLIRNDYRVAVAGIEAVSQLIMPKELFLEMRLQLMHGEQLDLPSTIHNISAMGYERVSTVEARGTFAIRGGILDVYPIDSEYAVRIELFDDEVDSIRLFDAGTQRSVESVDQVVILPAREVLYRERDLSAILHRISDAASQKGGSGASRENTIGQDLEKFDEMRHFPGIDRYLTFIYPERSTAIHYLDEQTVVVLEDPIRAFRKLESVLLEHAQTCRALQEKGRILPDAVHAWQDFHDFMRGIPQERLLCVSALPIPRSDELPGFRHDFQVSGRTALTYQGDVQLLKTDIRERLEKGWTVLLLTMSVLRGTRLFDMLVQEGIPARLLLQADGVKLERKPEAGVVNILHGSFSTGFEYPAIQLLVICDAEFQSAEKQKKRIRKMTKGSKIDYFTDLTVGDYIVHQSHGVGIFKGLEQLKVEGVARDYLKIQYRGSDNLYIPTNQLDLVQKYIGTESKAPKVNSLGGAEWARTKNRVKQSLQKLAAELIVIYAKRRRTKGFEFSPDTVWQKQFEETFPFEETEDQLRSIEEIKEDMESPRLMDRLLCGDVGFGKTEVAVRAVFKAVNDSKQAAFLVPTTVLAQQHYLNFLERFRDFPVTIEVLSRFRTKKEQTKIIEELKNGNIDVVVGTHRLLGKEVGFKDLGLLVVDEEQRFGVAHKEKLKKLKPDVDVISLSATPIPRTLHMSMTKIRDISVLKDPPEERFPVQTFVMEYDEDVIREAIVREVARNGQVFYLYNRVRGIDIKTMQLQNLLPADIRIAYAHGQMGDRELEDMMLAFIDHRYDVLVCTTIIESGLDMPNVNTIVVEDSDRMGLAQLYQLRGRVGRSNRLAYAYITHRKGNVVTEEAEKRLKAIREFTELGSGFKIAMRDMEIRGIGNLLGTEQHGHMERVGYDMYCRLLDETVREMMAAKRRKRDGTDDGGGTAGGDLISGGGMVQGDTMPVGATSGSMTSGDLISGGDMMPGRVMQGSGKVFGGTATGGRVTDDADDGGRVTDGDGDGSELLDVDGQAFDDSFWNDFDEDMAEAAEAIDSIEEQEVMIDINVSAYIDREYIEDERLRLEMYQKIAWINSDEDAMDVTDELLDRFSEPPCEVTNLIKIAKIKSRARQCGIASIVEKKDAITFTFMKSRSLRVDRISPLLQKYKRQVLLNAGEAPYILFKPMLPTQRDMVNKGLSPIPDIVLRFLDDLSEAR